MYSDRVGALVVVGGSGAATGLARIGRATEAAARRLMKRMFRKKRREGKCYLALKISEIVGNWKELMEN